MDNIKELKSNNRFITELGGIAIPLTNKTGSNSVKGTVVTADTTTDFAFKTHAADDDMPIGIVYESGIADGSECWVVISGCAEVLLEDGTASTRGYWVRSGATTAGRADATTANPPGGTVPALETHMKELGHCLESKTSGTDVLARIIMHFN